MTSTPASGSTTTPAVIRASGLTKRYGDLVAVDALDLVIAPGDIVAILGPNGAGKSTTIEMLLGLRTPTAGEVRVFGDAPNAKATRARVGAMLQESSAPESLTVAEAVDLVRHYYPFALSLDDILDRADLSEKRGNRIAQLSGGQQQRLNFALAIAGDPDLLFLDEPTAALDVEARHLFWEQVRGLAAHGKTILFSTHNLAEADALADRVILINRGRVIADGTPEQIKATVATRTVRLVTDVGVAALAAFPGVRGVEVAPGESVGATHPTLVVQTATPEDLLARLFAGGHLVSQLTVTDTDLETAFIHLVGATTQTAPTATPDTTPEHVMESAS
ncbi:MAG: ABC transporter ATP-binding protein [Actinomycetales bacterium]|jgi:ABC-2 type transport system ATP-binding protein|uniref:ABC transporter ATP-binding protein n=1 Tax=Candidatus Phosphoribacter hodrii TaxID=2953743 RepID=A0A935M7U2_9MICO|nr:ABC transporter ATP-binding protein [Candidatus Phosphoribacter hodrii]MBK7274299.1 ABC transporter ATP-binding protein [Candidatus Phosphoribacter hodrii]OPZ55873.1 MAG: Daunorubicin/doxorubicin resistance ATP-binding protein DrrA [bacterium ADurb.BinA028]HPZ69584.1 ABC transporter ATP-binding protein [Dermatophilaceae bacterium]